jgi:hypothetical protein
MSDTGELSDYLIVRELDDPITREQLDAAAERSGEVLSELRSEGTGIEWADSEVLATEEGRVSGTVCHYRAESEEAVHEHAERAGLPVTTLALRDDPLDGE